MTRSSRSTDIFQSYDFSALRLSVSCYYLKKTWMYSARVKRYQIAVLDWYCCCINFITTTIIIFFDPGTHFPRNEKITLCNTKKYKNQAGMNLTPPPPSQNSHAVRWHCTAESKLLLLFLIADRFRSSEQHDLQGMTSCQCFSVSLSLDGTVVQL